MKPKKKSLIAAFGVLVFAIFLVWFSTDKKRDNATYTIIGGNEKIYYANTFRCTGHWIIFDDVYGKKVLLTGNVTIEKIKNEEL